MLEFLVIIFAVVAVLFFLSLEPMRNVTAMILDLSIAAYLILVISIMIWLF